MKNRMIIVSLLLISANLILAACGPAPEAEPETVEKTIYVGPELVDCVGVAPQQCMQVKEDPLGEYTLFYDQIEGFNHEEGYEYELIVREENIANPPQDSSSIKWVLVEEVSKTAVTANESGDTDAAESAELVEAAAEGEILTVFVGPELVDCVGVAPQTCLQVKTDPDHDYTLFYDNVEGFEYEPGYEYELRVLIEPVEDPPADASTLKYTLIEEVNKTPVEVPIAGETEEIPSAEVTLEGTTWTLLSIVTSDGNSYEVLPDTRVTAEFNNGQISGTAGCNNYFGSYETDGSSLTIGPGGSTMKACVPKIMLQETAFLATLSSVASYEIIEGQLHLQDVNGQPILLYAVEESLSLSSGIWNLISFNNGQEAMVSVIIGSEVTARFSEDGVLSGSAGCNRYSGGYEIEGDTITIGNLANTEMFCGSPEGVMEQEMQYLTALQNAAVYHIDGTRLEIRDANGSGVAYYEAAEATDLSGITWNLLFHNNGRGGMVSTIIDTQITAVFDEEGVLTGSAGCNNYTAAYETDDQQITIGPAASTRMFCAEPEGIMEQEAQYLAALENAAVYLIEGNGLEIRDAEGSGVASYEVLEESAATGEEVAEIDNAVPETPEAVESSADTAGEAAASAEAAEEIVDAVANASYPLDYTGTGTIQLANGSYSEPAAEDSAAEITTSLTDHIAVGQLSNGQNIVAVILTTQTGGTGTFYDLVVINEQDGLLTNPAAIYLGDRIVVNSLDIENGQIVVDMVVQGPEDPFCCPTEHEIQIYELQNGTMVQVSSEVQGTVEPQTEAVPEIANILWKWQELVTPVEQITIDSPDNYTVKFKEDGLVDISADCNVGSGTYELDGSNISINVTATTLALCDEGSYGDLFFRSLDNVAIYFMDGENLMMDQVADAGTMRFFE